MDDITPVFDPKDPLAALSGLSLGSQGSAGATPRLFDKTSAYEARTALAPGDHVAVDYKLPIRLPVGAKSASIFTAEHPLKVEGSQVVGKGVMATQIDFSDGRPPSTITEAGVFGPVQTIGPVVSSSAKAA
jgi:hypothetical protein